MRSQKQGNEDPAGGTEGGGDELNPSRSAAIRWSAGCTRRGEPHGGRRRCAGRSGCGSTGIGAWGTSGGRPGGVLASPRGVGPAHEFSVARRPPRSSDEAGRCCSRRAGPYSQACGSCLRTVCSSHPVACGCAHGSQRPGRKRCAGSYSSFAAGYPRRATARRRVPHPPRGARYSVHCCPSHQRSEESSCGSTTHPAGGIAGGGGWRSRTSSRTLAWSSAACCWRWLSIMTSFWST